MKKLQLLLLVVFPCMMSCAYAQDSPRRGGTGEKGVNRRVVSPFGYGGVKGTYSEPVVKDLQINWTGRNNPKGYPIMSVKDVPQLYLGVQGGPGTEVDAGITWEKSTAFMPAPGVTQDYTGNGAWTIFYRLSGDNYIGGIPNNPKVAVGQLGDTELTFELQGLDGVLTWSSTHTSSSFSYPLKSVPTRSKQRKVKRVTALTQAAPSNVNLKINYDGQRLNDAQFSGGQVAPLTITTGSCSVGEYISWREAVEQYVAPRGKQLNAQARANLFASHYVPTGRRGISVSKKELRVITTKPDRNENGGPPPNLELFNAEKVSINVGSASSVTPKQLRANRRNPLQ